MTKEEFRNLLNSQIIVLDGATGTNLQNAGMPVGVCPEAWILEHPEVLMELQRAYIRSGSNIIYAPTFSGNRIKLAEYGLETDLERMNTRLVALSKAAVAKEGNRGYVAGDLTMTGQMLYPMGTMQFEELVEIYKEQAACLVNAGVDLFVVETMMSLAETRAAVIAIQEVCDLPIAASLTFAENGTTLYGTDPKTAVITLQSLGVDLVGVNCSTGPDKMLPIIREMKAYANIPLMAKPNAGMPEFVKKKTVYRMTPETFAAEGRRLVEAGVNVIGGCCGTTPAHIAALSRQVKTMDIPEVNETKRRVLCSERQTVELDINGPFMVVGERINPTGKKKLQAELREGCLDTVLTMAEEQEQAGAAVLDINMGMNGIDEKEMLIKVLYEVGSLVNLPLCIDSSHVDIIEAALRVYPGRALINSISLEKEKIEKLLPVAKRYGAMFILLPLSDEGLPKSKEEKHEIIHNIMDAAFRQGFSKEDIIVDGLVATVGANKMAAIETLETISYCKNQLGVATICGLSNISFGLPERIYVNTAFLTMAVASGLTMAIANPGQDMLINAAFASDLLMNREAADVRYIERMNRQKELLGTAAPAGEAKPADGALAADSSRQESPKTPVYEAVLRGNRSGIGKEVDQLLAENIKPQTIIDSMLIPAINEVGELFNQKIYFLPQLIASAEAMEVAIGKLEPLLEKKEQEKPKGTIVIATVEGDIHDIGKNLVVLMLKNYGYRVIDLGKDVPAKKIVEVAKTEQADIIGLSALMTTTMLRMQDVVQLVKQEKLPVKVIIGGAVITPEFAEEIGADGYSKDAAEAVKLVERLLKQASADKNA
ncbi:MAG: homocysteine S-methyltransferase family protein [Lachnospiraceae bacterium]|nr:homocysteine S-methyltransferase family protein [Lachnospiraceae bacterium]